MSATIFAGCGPKYYEKQHYILDTQRASTATAGNNMNIVEVRRFTIASAFNSKNLIYRVGEFEYESDFYNEFLVSPTAIITEKTRNWLAGSGVARRVLDPGSNVDPTHIIEGNVIALYGDFRAKSSPKAIMEIRIFLLETKTETESGIVFGKTYTSSVGIESRRPEDLVSAFDRCLIEILTDLEKDLAERLL
jgi:cholesterol transport system auxiliary component